ncbi:unnamed protein product [Caenorhabditis sp. 36 PRJEB53466]|nr:unnamed protein product [Caenorhabditis sp. 36 PRJEB53466]
MDAFAAKRLETIFNGKKIPPMDIIDFVDVTLMMNKEEGLGLEIKNLMVVSMSFTSPCLGQVKVGDVLLHLNGNQIQAQDKMSKLIQSQFMGQPVAKVTFKMMRFKRHIARPATFPPLVRHEGFNNETHVLYNLKGFFHLGLDVKEIEGKLVVCDIVENSLSDITFSLGEAILDVDGEKTATCVAFNERVKKSLEIRNFCLVTVEMPSTDPLKNLLRNKISTAQKDGPRINRIPADVKGFAAEGIAIFRKHCNDPLKPVWMGDRLKVSKECPKDPTHLKMDEKVKETDVPSGWNSCLFVRLPPLKTLETETLPQ